MLPPGQTKTQQMASVGRKYILQIFIVFAKEACKLGKLWMWTAQRIDGEALLFLRRLVIDVGVEYADIGVPYMIGTLGDIRPDVLRELKSSAEWKTYQNELLEVAELQSTHPKGITVPSDGPQTKSDPLSNVDRRALWNSYKASFPDVVILDICWAAGQHYSEWKRWLRGPDVLKNGSYPDRAFRAILTSGKTPLQHRNAARPPGWK